MSSENIPFPHTSPRLTIRGPVSSTASSFLRPHPTPTPTPTPLTRPSKHNGHRLASSPDPAPASPIPRARQCGGQGSPWGSRRKPSCRAKFAAKY
ncbi:hypothetical protein EX30DRAFT_343377 [Ascodesmis nigricans]|uniref:Uncharacterized protein n=1 Tax=Ascodesmis nigricans TaxID=341454 RepID=A0A4V3SHZ8_9PEZI|nr:hypothetical protein EX30DRAFT_343377 [Ascodesmis nigricans]